MKSVFKMKGMDFGNSPVKQDKVVPTSKYEKSKNTYIAEESDDAGQKKDSLEQRIFYLKEQIKEDKQEGPTKNRAQLMKLENALVELQKK